MASPKWLCDVTTTKRYILTGIAVLAIAGCGGVQSLTRLAGAPSTSPAPTATPLATTPSPVAVLPETGPQPPAAQTPPATQPAPPAGALAFLHAPIFASRNHGVSLQARTTPNASCRIAVNYKAAPSPALNLTPKLSDSRGNVSWTWMVGPGATPGQWPIVVTCGPAQAKTYINVS